MKAAAEEKEVRHPIRFKIFLVSLVPTLALLVAAILNNRYLARLGESAERILSKNYRSIRAAQESRKSLEQIRNILLEGVLRREPVRIPGALLDRLANNLDICRQNITEADEAGGRWRLDERFSAFLTATAEMVAILDDLVALNETVMERSGQRARGLADRAQRNAAILFGIIVAAILALIYLLSCRIARPIMTLAQSLSSAKPIAATEISWQCQPSVPQSWRYNLPRCRNGFQANGSDAFATRWPASTWPPVADST